MNIDLECYWISMHMHTRDVPKIINPKNALSMPNDAWWSFYLNIRVFMQTKETREASNDQHCVIKFSNCFINRYIWGFLRSNNYNCCVFPPTNYGKYCSQGIFKIISFSMCSVSHRFPYLCYQMYALLHVKRMVCMKWLCLKRRKRKEKRVYRHLDATPKCWQSPKRVIPKSWLTPWRINYDVTAIGCEEVYLTWCITIMSKNDIP